MKVSIGAGLLASAFAPLVALLVVLRLEEWGWIGWAVLVACALAVVLLFLVLTSARSIQDRPVQTRSVRRADERILGFMSTYVVPVLLTAFGPEQKANVIATVALVALLVVVYVRGGLYHLNPVLTMIGYRLYEITAVNGTVTMLLTRDRHVPQQGTIRALYLSEDVALQGVTTS